MNLQDRAERLFTDEHLREGWVAAVTYLRERNLWIADPGTPTPKWALPQDERSIA